MNLEQKIEAVLFFKNEPVSVSDLSKWLSESVEDVRAALSSLQNSLQGRGVALVLNGDQAALGTHPDASSLIETLQKEELSRELGRAGLETLAIILYKGPISRREIDHIRGVNSGFTLRALMVRGLIERVDPTGGVGADRSYNYRSTLKLLEHLGVTRIEELPEFENAFNKLDEFIKSQDAETQDNA